VPVAAEAVMAATVQEELEVLEAAAMDNLQVWLVQLAQ
jgi:hypothetical protein